MASTELVQNILDLITEQGSEFKRIRILISGSGTGDVSGLQTDATNLVSAINEVLAIAEAGGGGTPVVDLDDLTDVTIVDPQAGQIIRYDGTQWVNVTGTSHFQPRSPILDEYAATDPTEYGKSLLVLASRTALRDEIGYAAENVAGLVPLATNADLDAGVNTTKAVTPAQVERAFVNFIGAAPSDLNEWAEVVQRIIEGESDLASLMTAVNGKQDADPTLAGIAALSATADTMIYATGADSFSLAPLTAYARTLLAAADAAAARDVLSVYSRAQIGDPETDFVAAFNAAIA